MSKKWFKNNIKYYLLKNYLILYIRNKGDMTLILETIILSTNEDLDRFLKFYEK